MVGKIFLSADELLADSFILAKQIYLSGFRPDWVVGIWRGGTPIAIAVHEYFKYSGHETQHLALQAISYRTIKKQAANIELRGISKLLSLAKSGERILLVDDVFDSGRSLEAMINAIYSRNSSLKIYTATPWFKPDNNKTKLEPDFYLKTTDKWIVFPHELVGLSSEDIKDKPVKMPKS